MAEYRVSTLKDFEWQQAVEDRVTQPAGGESKGHRYLVTTGAGDFAGEDGNIATAKQDNPAAAGDWYFDDKREGMTVYVKDEDKVYQYITAWNEIRISALFDADRDTGIEVEQSADEDKIKFKTAGTERMIIDENGNVGIGTDSPDEKVHIAQAGGLTNLNIFIDNYTDDDRAPILWLRKSHSDTLGTLVETIDGELLGDIIYRGVDSGSNSDYGAHIKAIQDGAAGTRVPTNLFLETWSATDKNENQLVLHNDGNIGIGTDTPVARLEVEVPNNGNQQALLIEQLDTTNNPVCAEINNDGTNHGLYLHQDGVLASGDYGLYLYSDAAQVNSPLAYFQLNSASSTQPVIEIDNNGTGHGLYIHQDGVSAATKHALYVYTNAVQNAAPLVFFEQDNLSGDQDLLVLQQDGTGYAINITSGQIKLPNGTGIDEFSTDGTMAGNSDDAVPTEKAIVTYVGSGIGVKAYADGTTYIEGAADTERSTTLITYTKLKEFSPIVRGGTVTITWQMRQGTSGSDYTAFSKVYVNGIAVGDEKTSDDNSYTNYTETNVIINVGDVIQIYGKNQLSGAATFVRNMKIKCLNPTIPEEVSGY